MFDERYEVYREDYKNFIETFKPKYRRIEEEDCNNVHITKVFSINDNECLGARVSYEDQPEKYYIFKLPSSEERTPPIPKQRVVLNDIKQVQAFFDGLQKMQELYKNGNGNF